jgi:hypothetical protein
VGGVTPAYLSQFAPEEFVFARLDEAAQAAQALEGEALRAELGRIGALRRIAAWHSIYVDPDDLRSTGGCFTCDSSLGDPCVTMRNLTALWSTHPEWEPGWADQGSFLAEEIAAGGFRRAYQARREGAVTNPAKPCPVHGNACPGRDDRRGDSA